MKDIRDFLGPDHGGSIGDIYDLYTKAPAYVPEQEPAVEGATAEADVDDGRLDPRPEILLRNELAAVTDAALNALEARAANDLFVRGGILVRAGRDGVDREKWITRPPGAPAITVVTLPFVRELMDRAAKWVKWDLRTGRTVPALPPEWAAASILDRGLWPFRPLDSIVEVPVLRRDGSILETPGYDAATFVIFDPILTFARVPANPTREDARRALALILDVIRDFPFVSDSAKSAAIALFLTLIGREAIDGPVPLFAVRAPTPGSGKGLFLFALVLAATGRVPAVMSEVGDDDELRKHILALGLAGDRVVVIDNVDGVLGSDTLAMAVASTSFQGRLLGSTKLLTVPLRAVWCSTGNNTRFRATMGRRVVPIDLDPQCEHPEDRDDFHHKDLLPYVNAIRADLVVAGLTLLRAFCVAGRPPHGHSRMGSFEAWDDLVRSCCVWLGIADPGATDDPSTGRGRIRADADEDLEAIGGMLCALHDAFCDARFTTADVVERVASDTEFKTALLAVAAGRGGQIDSRSIGGVFKKCRDRRVGAFRLVSDGKVRGGYAAWRVSGDSPPQPPGGESSAEHHARSDVDGRQGESPATHHELEAVDDVGSAPADAAGRSARGNDHTAPMSASEAQQADHVVPRATRRDADMPAQGQTSRSGGPTAGDVEVSESLDFEERAAIREHDGGQSRSDAERGARAEFRAVRS